MYLYELFMLIESTGNQIYPSKFGGVKCMQLTVHYIALQAHRVSVAPDLKSVIITNKLYFECG